MLDKALPALVAVHGIKRSGKGTIAAYLIDQYGYEPIKLADPLKNMSRVALRRLCGLSEVDIERCIEGDLKEVPIPALGGKSGRYMMQMLGTEWRDLVSLEMWSSIASARIRGVIGRGGRVVTDDVRFPHEVELMKSLEASLWAVTSTHCAERATPRIGGLPWDPAEAPQLQLTREVVQEMTGVLLQHCGVPQADLASYLDVGHADAKFQFADLGFRTPLHLMATLSNQWAATMRKAVTPNPANTLAHVSEQMLPREWFSKVFENNSTFEDLYAQVEAAMARQPVMAGPR